MLPISTVSQVPGMTTVGEGSNQREQGTKVVGSVRERVVVSCNFGTRKVVQRGSLRTSWTLLKKFSLFHLGGRYSIGYDFAVLSREQFSAKGHENKERSIDKSYIVIDRHNSGLENA